MTITTEVKQLGLKQPSYSLVELLKAGQTSFNSILFIERDCDLDHKVKHYHHLSETERNHPKIEIVNEDTGHFVVKESQSVIFYSFDPVRGISSFPLSLFPKISHALV